MDRPLTLNHALLGFVHDIHRQNARAVALLLPRNWDGDGGKLRAALDSSATYRSHGALVNLVQHCKAVGAATQDCTIYMSAPPTRADKGMFIEQVHGTSTIIYLSGLNTWEIAPSKAQRDGVPAPIERCPQIGQGRAYYDWVELKDPKNWYRDVVPGGGPNQVRVRHEGQTHDVTLPGGQAGDLVREVLNLGAADIRLFKTILQPALPNVALPAPPLQAGTYGGLSDAEKRIFDRIYLSTALSLVPLRIIQQHNVLANADGNHVGSILVGENGQMLAWGLNVKDRNATLHAEVSTLKDYQRRSGGAAVFPARSRLYTTLEPCFMCAGQIVGYEDVNGFEVVFAQSDPAFGGNQTALAASPIRCSSADALNIRYKGATGWATRLGAKQTELDVNRQAGGGNNLYARSTIAALADQASFRRRFAKATLQLTALVDEITDNLHMSGATRGFLMGCLQVGITFLMRAGGFTASYDGVTFAEFEAFMRAMGAHLDATRGQNALRGALGGGPGAAYQNRHALRAHGEIEQRAVDLAENARLALGFR